MFLTWIEKDSNQFTLKPKCPTEPTLAFPLCSLCLLCKRSDDLCVPLFFCNLRMRMQQTFDIGVIGNGMMGAAATRYLSTTGQHIVAIGPGEPEDWQSHQGVFASHYDQGRITRIID